MTDTNGERSTDERLATIALELEDILEAATRALAELIELRRAA